jgi:hypothetical protein
MMEKTSKAKRTEKVWRVVDYRDLFFAETANRTQELEQVQYTQRHISASFNNPAAQRHLNRMAGLQDTLGFTDYLIAKELFERLLDRSQLHRGQDKYLRGYVVDERLRPAGVARIASLVRMPVTQATIEKAIKQLDRCGLLEQSEMPLAPHQPTPPIDPPAEPVDSSSETAGKKSSKTSAKSGKAARKTAAQKDLDEVSIDIASKCTSMHLNRESEEDLDPRPSASVEQEIEIDRTSEPTDGDGETEGDAGASPWTAEKETDTDRGKRQGPLRNDTGKPTGPLKPKTEADTDRDRDCESRIDLDTDIDDETQPTEPIGPTETEGGVSFQQIPSVQMESVLNRIYDHSGHTYADAVYRAIGVPHALDSPKGRAEFEAFATAWQRAIAAKLPPSALNEIWHKGLKTAHDLERKRSRGYRFRKSAEATWMHMFFERVATVKSKAIGMNKDKCKAL